MKAAHATERAKKAANQDKHIMVRISSHKANKAASQAKNKSELTTETHNINLCSIVSPRDHLRSASRT
eukprot:9201150-Prorocentrum_lima.AAC.1